MKTAGKFYLRLNILAAKPYYWAKPIQNWTTDPHDATFFDTKGEAETEARHADFHPGSTGEISILRATRDLPDPDARA